MKTIEEIRKNKGISKVAVARHLGVSRPCYSRYENDPSTMRIETAKKVAEFLGVDVQDIFFISDRK
ncbi:MULTISPECIES: helix-turn-helix transcriptional regulator [Gordonibacter]|uniref:Helix-turn-helix transcriptional regulator n=1 Tax=Gordonibacter faecis TaxID=3047475 RepID=A0ABT7DQ23_9ACTN|nr:MULTISPECIES: helix-turn-helix transcriptional regulator [unclassified Gordonibacter]MDJ1651660.1 helix-turn-helix transcriptional regulator [Gordonibacter sp. KGMB12511]HIW77084.1 helix-turn-helix domain-containing protein [Candidatus Gordonibacter avicola]